MLSNPFMQRALLAAIILGITMPFIGVLLVLKRWSSVGDALSHGSLAGVAIGLLLGKNPTIAAMIFSIIMALLMEITRKVFKYYAEVGITILMSLGIGLTALFSGWIKNGASFSSFLFGSIVSVTGKELVGIAIIALAVIMVSMFFYWAFFYIAFDETGAKINGVPVEVVNVIFSIMTAIVIAISSRLVGALVTSSMLVLPVSCAMQWSKSYKGNLIFSMFFSFMFMVIGLVLSYYLDIKPSAAIVLFGVLTLLCSVILARKRRR